MGVFHGLILSQFPQAREKAQQPLPFAADPDGNEPQYTDHGPHGGYHGPSDFFHSVHLYRLFHGNVYGFMGD